MKNNFLKVFALSGAFALSLGVAINIIYSTKQVKEVDASSYSTSSVTTTIDLNDATDSTIRNYYSSLNSLSASERRGTNLLKNLKPILKNGQKYFSYGSSATTAVWQIYEIIDRDWVKSPASAISGYNSSTNIITGYSYGTSNSSVGSNPYIHALYVNRGVENKTRAWGNHNQDQWGINQEHIWAKSCGFSDNSPGTGARGDVMHLWAGNGKVNGTYHSNYYYGYVDTTKTYDDAKTYASTLSGNRKGSSKTLGGSYTVFEPQDSDKGDIARALFYMVARYNYLSGSDSDGIDAGNPNLEIVNQLNWAPGSSYTSSTSKKGQMGILQDLLEWNRLDPPDEWEIHRNNLCYNNYTNNRNPFIDFPEWAEYIWGKSVDGDYSSASTGYATPSSDTINDFSGGTPVPTKTLSSISISGQKTTFDVGDTFSFGGTVTAHYSDSTTADVTSSSDFDGYNMSTAGNQTITVSYTEGGVTKTTTYNITVNPVVTLSYITISGQQTVFNVGDEFEFGGTVTAHYSDDTTADVTDDATFSGYNLNNAGNQTVTVSYTEGGITRTTTYNITVSKVITLEYITVSDQQTVFTVGDDFDFGGVVTAHYSDDSTANVTYSSEFSGYDMSVAGQQTVTVSYTEGSITEETSYTITVTSSGGDIPSGDAALYSGALTEGDYVIYYDGKAMKNTVSSNRLSYLEVTPTNDIISQPDESIIWHIAPSGDYWTIYNVSVARYAAGNGAKNQGALITSVNDYAKWTVSGTETYEFVNKGNDSAGVNKYLRNNGTYGFACYSTSTGGALSLYKVSDSPIVPVDPTSISATVSKTYKVGETINKSDITVIDDLNRTITDFSFANDGYQFTYADAASGGELTNKVFTNAITFGALSCSLTAQVQRESYSAPSERTITVNDFSSVTDTASTAKTQTLVVDGITFKSTNSYKYSDMLSFKTTKATDGNYQTDSVFYNQTKFATNIIDVDLTLGGNNKPTIDATIEYSADNENWSTINDGECYYFRIRYEGTFTGYVNIVSVAVTLASGETLSNVVNYIMFEDTAGQCENGKFENAKIYFQNMSNADRQTFMTSDDYVISSARARFVAWATHLGQSIEYVDGDYIVKTNMDSYRNIVDSNDDTAIMVIVIALFTISLVGTLLLIKKKKMR